MKNLCFGVTAMAVGLYLTGAMANPPRKHSVVFSAACQWDGHLLTDCSFTGKHGIPGDVSQTAATVGVSSSFIGVLLQSPTDKEQSIKHLDLSNNRLSTITLSSFAHLHALEIVNLSHNAIHSISLDLPRPKSSKARCPRSSGRNGLPHLKLLILQGNNLGDIPKGLWKLKSLRSLDLSFNGISQVGVSDFHKCLQLENLYLRSNKIFRIHPEAFKDLKKLQVVDLSSNTLTAVLPMMAIALGLPCLDADLADNQWQCDDSVVAFQNFISESWRRKWDEICHKSIGIIPGLLSVKGRMSGASREPWVFLLLPALGNDEEMLRQILQSAMECPHKRATGNEEASWQTPKRRVSREIQLPHTELHHTKSFIRSKAVRPQEGTYRPFSTLGKKDHEGSDTSEQQRWPPRWVRSTQDVQVASRKEAASQDLALAVCLAVFITFLVAFCLGAFARPYLDRLWQQRCRKKQLSSDHVYHNEGYNEMEAAGNIQHPRADLHHACHGLTLCSKQDPFLRMETCPQSAVIPDRSLGMSRKEPGSRQSREQGRNDTGAASRKDTVLPNGSAACPVIHGPPNAASNTPISAEQDHLCRNGILGEINHETEAPEYSLGQYSLGVPVTAGRLQTGPGSIHKGVNELDPLLWRDMRAALSETQTRTKAQRTGENEERSTKPLPSESSKDVQASTSISFLNTQEQRFTGAGAKGEHFTYYCSTSLSDLADTNPSPPGSPPGWGNDPPVTPANKEPVQKPAPWDTQHELDINYDSDSDEGSLFTLSSTSSEGGRDVSEEQADGEESRRTSEVPGDEDSGVRKDNMTPFECLEDDITFQKSQEKCENQEDLFEKPFIYGSDSGLYESHLESATNTSKLENPLTLSGSLGNCPSRDETPDSFISDYVSALQSEAAEWHCSLKDLEFFNVDTLPQTPPCSADVSSDPDTIACHERDSDNCTQEHFTEGTDTDPNNIPFQIPSGEHLQPSQQDSKNSSMHLDPLDTDTNENHDSREIISQTQLLSFSGNELALQYERGGGE